MTKLQGAERGIYYELFMIIDIFGRYVVGLMVSPAETASSPRLHADALRPKHRA